MQEVEALAALVPEPVQEEAIGPCRMVELAMAQVKAQAEATKEVRACVTRGTTATPASRFRVRLPTSALSAAASTSAALAHRAEHD